MWTRGSALVLLVAALALTGCAPQDQGTPLDAPGVDATIELTAPATAGVGPIPTFEWSAVQGATVYRLVVLNADGNATWAWEGAETSIPLGAVVGREVVHGGPVLSEGSFWSVVALDAEGHVVAVSKLRPVSP